MAYFPFDRGRIFKRASGTPLPEWAAEFSAAVLDRYVGEYQSAHGDLPP